MSVKIKFPVVTMESFIHHARPFLMVDCLNTTVTSAVLLVSELTSILLIKALSAVWLNVVNGRNTTKVASLPETCVAHAMPCTMVCVCVDRSMIHVCFESLFVSVFGVQVTNRVDVSQGRSPAPPLLHSRRDLVYSTAELRIPSCAFWNFSL